VAFRWKHPTQKKQMARLHRFHISAERLGCAGSLIPISFNR